MYNACRVDGHSVFLIRDVIYKNVVGLGSGSVQLIYEAENMLTAPHTTELNLIMPCFLQYVFETQCEFSVNSLQLLYLQTPLSAAVLLIFIPILEPESVDKFLSPVSSWSLATVVCINLLLYRASFMSVRSVKMVLYPVPTGILFSAFCVCVCLRVSGRVFFVLSRVFNTRKLNSYDIESLGKCRDIRRISMQSLSPNRGYCFHFVCLSVCPSVCLSVRDALCGILCG